MLDKAFGAKDRSRQAAAGAVIEMAEKAENAVGEEGILDDYKRAAADKGLQGVAAKAATEGQGGHREGSTDRRATHDRGQSGADGAVELVVALVVGGLMAAFLLPIAIDEIVGVDTSSWTDGSAAMWEILPVMIVLAIFLFFVGVALKRSNTV